MQNTELINFRKNKGFSAQTMATEVGVSKSYYEKIEYGNRLPSFNFINKFKTAFPDADVDCVFLSQNHT